MKHDIFNMNLRIFFYLLAVAILVVPKAGTAGSLDPTAAPAPTMRTLEEQRPAWNKVLPVAQRFVDALDGNAVLDKETGLVWAKSPDATQRSWDAATGFCANLTLGGRKGWRLPTREELASLLEPSVAEGAQLPSGHPFLSVAADSFWSSSVSESDASFAWSVSFANGGVISSAKTGGLYVWPVRSGR